jgi:anti-sigma-K factor RskA
MSEGGFSVDHAAASEALGAYALGAVEGGEATRIATHVASCRVCFEELERLRGAVHALPELAEELEPSPALKERLMATVRKEAAATAAEKRARDRRSRRAGFGLTLRPVAGVALASVLALGGVAGYLVGDDGQSSTRTVAAQVSGSVSGAQADVLLRDGRARLVVSGMPQPPRGRVYQVWVQRAGSAPVPTAALFSPTRDGRGSVDVPGDLRGSPRVLVTDEPAGGSLVPTRAPVIAAALPA